MLIDSHIHFHLPANPKEILHALDLEKADFGCLVSQIDKNIVSESLDCLYAKDLSEGRLYTFGALNPMLYYHHDQMNQMKDHVENLIKCGIDGIKMIEGKPTDRIAWPMPKFDDMAFDDYFSFMEERQIPIVWHVNDPEEFWDEALCPDWAKKSGWFYDDKYVRNSVQYEEIENLLKRHPNLNITFAHFFFLSADLDRLGQLFDSYPNIGVDITPGIELFENMAKDIARAKAFFTRYQDRIYYGTDISVYLRKDGTIQHENDTIQRGILCHDFLTSDHVFIKGDENGLLGKDDFMIKGLSLDDKIVKKIEYDNFFNKVGKPRKINQEEILKEIKRQKERFKELESIRKIKLDDSNLLMLEQYYEGVLCKK